MKRIEYFMRSAGTPDLASGTRWVRPTARSAESTLGDACRKTVSLRLKMLKEAGLIERIGSDRKGYWKLLT